MIKFDKKIVQFGFGAVGKSFFEKVRKEIKFNINNYIVISANKDEVTSFAAMGGIVQNFHNEIIEKNNYIEVFSKYLTCGDLLIDFADSVGTRDICQFCIENNIMYLNTGETDWPEHWYSIFEENLKKHELAIKYDIKHPIVLQHGNNPGLVSHFVKAGLEYIIKNQFKHDKELIRLLKENQFNLIAQKIGLRQIHVNDIDKQEINNSEEIDKLYTTWSMDSFFFEMLSEGTVDVGTNEENILDLPYNSYDKERGFLEYKDLSLDLKCNTYYPEGKFQGYLVPHEETITIADSLEVKNMDGVVYRPTVAFIYLPCKAADNYFKNNRVNDYLNPDPNKPQDTAVQVKNSYGFGIVRGYNYPKKMEVIYEEQIKDGTEFVGVLLIGDKFNPVWVGNRIKLNYLYKHKKDSYWQTPTITPVSMSALAAACWMIENKDKGGIYFPDNIMEYKDIIKRAEKYISKTIYKEFDKDEIYKELNLNKENLRFIDIIEK